MSEYPPLPGSAPGDTDLCCLECGYDLRGLTGNPRRCPECGRMNAASAGEPPPLPGVTSSDIDLYCLDCGYNLRGLTGDPRRCPECGHLNPMGDLALPASTISAQLRKMESNPAYCVLACLLGALFSIPLLQIVLTPAFYYVRGRPSGNAFFCASLPLIVAVVTWIICASQFRTSCRARPGWDSALFTYHLYAISLSLGVLALLALPGAVGAGLYSLGVGEATSIAAGLIALVAGIIGFCPLAVRSHQRLKSILTPLQRDVAVEIAREMLRKRLAKRHAGW